MRHIEIPPGWATRLKERSRLRRSGNRITRWIALPAHKARLSRDPAAAPCGSSPLDHSSNDNMLDGTSRVAG